MALSPAEVWDRLLARARQELSEQTFRTWLEPTAAVAVDERTLVVGTPDRFSADWNESKHATLLSGLAPVALGHPLTVTFQVNEALSKRPQLDFLVEPPPPAPAARATAAGDAGGAVTGANGASGTAGAARGAAATLARPASPAGRGTAPGERPPGTSAPLNPRYTFDHFVIGKSNDVAAASAQGAAQAPGKVYNPLFIYGETGLGKTHLMQAVAHVLLERDPGTRVTYVNTEQFTNEFISALQSRTTPEFRRRYRETDLLLVDDVQFLKGKESTQEEFFHTFNAIYEAGRQICLTSDRPPSAIPGLESRLVSRFEWGLVAHVDQPDLEHRVAILRKKAEQDHLELTIPDEVLEFVATYVKSSVRELEGSIIKLLAYASLKHRDISVDLAREALRDKLRAEEGWAALAAAQGIVAQRQWEAQRGRGTPNGPNAPTAGTPGGLPGVTAGMPLTAFTIQQAVAAEWGVTVEGLQSKTRTKTLTVPRQVAMWLCRELLALQLVEIGNAFGGRDHSTVIHSLERATAMQGEDERFRGRVEKVRALLETLRT